MMNTLRHVLFMWILSLCVCWGWALGADISIELQDDTQRPEYVRESTFTDTPGTGTGTGTGTLVVGGKQVTIVGPAASLSNVDGTSLEINKDATHLIINRTSGGDALKIDKAADGNGGDFIVSAGTVDVQSGNVTIGNSLQISDSANVYINYGSIGKDLLIENAQGNINLNSARVTGDINIIHSDIQGEIKFLGGQDINIDESNVKIFQHINNERFNTLTVTNSTVDANTLSSQGSVAISNSEVLGSIDSLGDIQITQGSTIGSSTRNRTLRGTNISVDDSKLYVSSINANTLTLSNGSQIITSATWEKGNEQPIYGFNFYGEEFTLDQDSTLDLTNGRMRASLPYGKTNQTITLNGKVILGTSPADRYDYWYVVSAISAPDGTIIFGQNAEISLGGNYLPNISAAMSGNSFQKVSLVEANDIQGFDTKTLQTTIGQLVLKNEDGKEINLTEVKNFVPFNPPSPGPNPPGPTPTPVEPPGWSQFNRNLRIIYGDRGFTTNRNVAMAIYGVAADATYQQGEERNPWSLWGTGSAGNFNYTQLLNANTGMMPAAMGTFYTGVNQAKAALANQESVRQDVTGITSRMAGIRRYFMDKGFMGNDAFASALFNSDLSNRVWATPIGSWTKADEKDDYAGYTYDSYGLLVGFDRMFGAVAVGGSLGYQRGTYKDNDMDSNNSKISTWSASLYSQVQFDDHFHMTALLGHSWHKNKMAYGAGGIHIAEDYTSGTTFGEARFGYDYQVGNAVITPNIGLGYISTTANGHDAKVGGAGSVVSYDKKRSSSWYVPVGVDAEYDAYKTEKGLLTLLANVGIVYNGAKDMGGNRMTLNGLQYANNGVDVSYAAQIRTRDKFTYNVGLGMRYSCEQWDASLKYDYFGQNKTRAHRLGLAASYSF